MVQAVETQSKVNVKKAKRISAEDSANRRDHAMQMIVDGHTNLAIERDTQAKWGTKIDNGTIAKLRKKTKVRAAKNSVRRIGALSAASGCVRLPKFERKQRAKMAHDLLALGKSTTVIESATKAKFGVKISRQELAKLRRRPGKRTSRAAQPEINQNSRPTGAMQLAAQYMLSAMAAEGVGLVTLNAETRKMTAVVASKKTWDLT